MAARCLITGVDLLDKGVLYRGDLFEQGDHYIVNCNEHGRPALAAMPHHDKWVQPQRRDHFMRHGVYVIPKDELYLSLGARNYIEGDIHR